MSTLGELIEFTRHQLSGLDSIVDAVAAIALPVAATDLLIRVDDTISGATRGIAEIDLEMVRVKTINNQDASLTLYPFGRGYRGTRATTHAMGAEIRFNPSWAAASIAREINGVLGEIYPSVYAVRSTEGPYPPDGGAVTVADDAVGVISVWIEDRLRPGQWIREDRWDYNPDGSTVGAGLRIAGRYGVGNNVRVVYAARPRPFNLFGAMSQDFVTTTGLDLRAADLITLGVSKRLGIFIDVAKLPFIVASAADAVDTRARTPNLGGDVVKVLHSLFTARLAQEASILAREHPIRVHRTRGNY